jgi:hypothetical protein
MVGYSSDKIQHRTLLRGKAGYTSLNWSTILSREFCEKWMEGIRDRIKHRELKRKLKNYLKSGIPAATETWSTKVRNENGQKNLLSFHSRH